MVPFGDKLWPLRRYQELRQQGAVGTAGGHRLPIRGRGWNPWLGHSLAVQGLVRPLWSIPQDARRLGYWTILGPTGLITTDRPPIVRGVVKRTGVLRSNHYFLDAEPRALRELLPKAKGKEHRPSVKGSRPLDPAAERKAPVAADTARTSEVTDLAADTAEFSAADTAHPTGNSDRGAPAVGFDPAVCTPAEKYKPTITAFAAQHLEGTFHYFHAVLAHLGRRLLNQMIIHKVAQGLPSTPFSRPEYACTGCMLGNFRAVAVPRTAANRPAAQQLPSREYRRLELVAFDRSEGSRKVPSLEGNRWYTLFECYGTQMVWVVFDKDKSTFATTTLPTFLQEIESDGFRVEAFKNDPDPTYWTPEAKRLARRHNPTIGFQPTPPHKPQYNGLVESLANIVDGRVRAILAESPWMPNKMWQSAITYTIRRMTISVTTRCPTLAPIQRYKPGTIIDITCLKPWGTPCFYATTRLEQYRGPMPRFSHRGRLGYIVGEYDWGKAGYDVYDPQRDKVLRRVDVRLHAADAAYKPTPIQLLRVMQKHRRDSRVPLDVIGPGAPGPLPEPLQLPPMAPPVPFGGPTGHSEHSDERSQVTPGTVRKLVGEVRKLLVPYRRAPRPVRVAGRRPAEFVAGRRRKRPLRQPDPRRMQTRSRSSRINDDELAQMTEIEKIEALDELEELHRILRQQRRKATGRRPMVDALQDLQSQVEASAAQIIDALPPTPANWDEALRGPNVKEWWAAKTKEETGLDSQGTWVDAPDWKGRTVKSRWAFRVSREPDGSIKYRARLVAKGFSERKGIDYFETFAPTVSLKALFSLLHIAASRDWAIRSIDVGNAYLEAELDTEIYMDLPPEGDKPPRRVKLLKSIYGLKQAGELWNRLLNKVLTELGFTRSFSDPCVYVRVVDGERVYIATYVDDLLTLSNSESALDKLEEELSRRFKKLSLKGEAQGFLGMEFERDRARHTITVTQRQFITDAIHDEGLDDATPKPTPGSSTVDLNKAERGTREPMRAITGRIRYAVDHAHPEALFIASQLSSAAANPGDEHWKAANHCMRYLKGAADVGITLGGPAELQPEIFVDASYIEDGEARSQLGYCVRLNHVAGMVHSRSIRDTATSLSASEAELRALKEAVQEAIWFRHFLRELGFPPAGPMPVHEDNQAVVNLIATLKTCPRTRHLNKIRHFLIQQTQLHRVRVKKIAGEINIADTLTKALEKTRFLALRAGLLGEKLRAGETP